MEEVGPQVVSPMFMHQTISSIGRKRELSYQISNFQQPAKPQPPRKDNWNPNLWDWDSTRFVGKPVQTEIHQAATEQIRHREFETNRTKNTPTSRNKVVEVQEDDRLDLNLGGGWNAAEKPVPRPNKKVRSGSPGGGNYPMCQVDNCKEDLSSAKDYHRRHKVCELHSKSTKAIVLKQMQRFCQQCSRFHPLSEFDDGKRSCRRRLAGHNRRRRKTQQEDATSQIVLPGNRDNTFSGNIDLLNLLTVLASAQGKMGDKSINSSAVPDKDQIMQILSKINSLPLPMDVASKLQNMGGLSRKNPEQPLTTPQIDINGTSPSTMDLLAVLSGTSAGSSPNALPFLSQRSSQSSESEKSKMTSPDQAATPTLRRTTVEYPSVRRERSSSSHQSPIEDSDCQVQDFRSNLPLQLFSTSPESSSPPTLASSRKYFSSDSSNPMEDKSPTSSPIVQKLFPMQNTNETGRSEKMSINRGNENVQGSMVNCLPLELFGRSNRVAENGPLQNFPYQSGYTSSSGSDHSHSSSNSDAQDRTGRIIFKLFGKDPSQFPGTLRTQIYNWLSNSPSEMESYIRPGCVFLSVYVSMSSAAWDQIEGNLLQRVNHLVQDSDSDFWREVRFLVHTGRQLASHKEGKLRICKSWRTWNSPELISVSPLAIVAGEETTLLVRGRNLTNAGTKVHCAYMGGYKSTEVTGFRGAMYDEISLSGFQIEGVQRGKYGRCFIEVENGFKGNSFPLLIADATICKELKQLELDFYSEPKVSDAISEEQAHDHSRPRSKEEVLHFLNELGWLFQREKTSLSSEECSQYSLSRFRFLIVFSVERDYCALVKALLDMLVERNSNGDELSRESLETLIEIQLLNRAVKRRCLKMAEMLVQYSTGFANCASKKYIFPPNLVGPGGITPLHLAACMSNSDDMIDVLTNDPQEIGLSSWNSLLDSSNQSPYNYATMRDNHSYNQLVARKLADKRNSQVSLSISDSIDRSGLSSRIKRSCDRCGVVASKYQKRVPGSRGLFQGSYIHSMLAVAAVCVCVCLFMRAFPDVGQVAPFKWEKLGYGTS